MLCKATICFLVLSLALISIAEGINHHHHHHHHNGTRCYRHAVSPRRGLNLRQYMGRWYAQSFALRSFHYENEDDEPTESAVTSPTTFRCLSIDYRPYRHQEKHIRAEEIFLVQEEGKTKLKKEVFHAIVPNLKEPAIWTVYANGTGSQSNQTFTTTAVITSTDHVTYSIEYGCSTYNVSGTEYKIEVAVVWTRKREIGRGLTHFLDSLIFGLGFSREHLFPVEQSRCPTELLDQQ